MVESPPTDWYRPLGAHLRSAYLRYAFTKGTEQEADFLFEVLGLREGYRLLDVGCGPGRHSIALARRGVQVVGVDLSSDFLAVARRTAQEELVPVSFFEMDAREMPFEGEFDAVMSICEGAFSLGLDDLAILRSMGTALKPGGRLAAAAVNVFYVMTHMRDSGEFDPEKMLYRETVEVIGEDGSKRNFDMWNSCYTPRELMWLANGAGLAPDIVYGIEPGVYKQNTPSTEVPELLLLAHKESGE